MTDLLPLFLNLRGRPVLLVGGGPVATAKLHQLIAVGAHIRIVAPDVSREIGELAGRDRHASGSTISIEARRFVASDLDDIWLAVAAATPDANREVAEAAEPRHIFVNAVDDPVNATAFLSGVVRRDGVILAISTSGHAPALTSLLREALDAVLPHDLAMWVWRARAERVAWRRDGVPIEQRKPRLLEALNDIYRRPEGLRHEDGGPGGPRHTPSADVPQGVSVAQGFSPAMPWLSGPEDSWL